MVAKLRTGHNCLCLLLAFYILLHNWYPKAVVRQTAQYCRHECHRSLCRQWITPSNISVLLARCHHEYAFHIFNGPPLDVCDVGTGGLLSLSKGNIYLSIKYCKHTKISMNSQQIFIEWNLFKFTHIFMFLFLRFNDNKILFFDWKLIVKDYDKIELHCTYSSISLSDDGGMSRHVFHYDYWLPLYPSSSSSSLPSYSISDAAS